MSWGRGVLKAQSGALWVLAEQLCPPREPHGGSVAETQRMQLNSGRGQGRGLRAFWEEGAGEAAPWPDLAWAAGG